MKNFIYCITLFLLVGCSAIGSLATDALLGSASDGMDVTAQVGKENNKGLVNTKVDTSKEVDVGDVQGDALVDSGNSVTNSGITMIGLVLAGMLPPLLLLFYMMPSPRWLQRRHHETIKGDTGI